MKKTLRLVMMITGFIFLCNQSGAETITERDLKINETHSNGAGGKSKVSPQINYDKSWAVLIGIDRYKNSPFDKFPLNYAVKDAIDMGKLFKNSFNFSPENMFLLIDTPTFNRLLKIENRIIQKRDEKGSPISEEYILTDDSSEQLSGLKGITVKTATKKNIEETLAAIKRRSKENERVLAFFAGHGDTQSNIKTGGERGYIIPEDVEEDVGDYFSSAIPMDRIREISLDIPAKHTLFLVDACYSGLSANKTYGIEDNKNQTSSYIEKASKLPSSHVITAGRKGEKVVESSEWGHSAFTYKIIEGLKSGAADLNDDGFVTSTELGTYIGPVVTNLTAQVTNTPQTPDQARFFGDGEFIFTLTDQGTSHKVVKINKPVKEEVRAEIYEKVITKSLPSSSSGKTRIAVMGLKSEGVSSSLSSNLTEIIEKVIFELGEFELLNKEELQKEAERLIRCSSDDCLADIAKSRGANQIVTGKVGLVGNTYIVSLRRIDTLLASTINLETENCAGCSQEKLLQLVKELVNKLFRTPEKIYQETMENKKKKIINSLIFSAITAGGAYYGKTSSNKANQEMDLAKDNYNHAGSQAEMDKYLAEYQKANDRAKLNEKIFIGASVLTGVSLIYSAYNLFTMPSKPEEIKITGNLYFFPMAEKNSFSSVFGVKVNF